MWFWIALAAMIYGSVMCWINGNRKIVIISWIILLIGFFTVPALFGSGWAFVILQAVLALILLPRALNIAHFYPAA